MVTEFIGFVRLSCRGLTIVTQTYSWRKNPVTRVGVRRNSMFCGRPPPCGTADCLFHRNISPGQYEINESITIILMMRSRYYWDNKLTWDQGRTLHPSLQVRHQWGGGERSSLVPSQVIVPVVMAPHH